MEDFTSKNKPPSNGFIAALAALLIIVIVLFVLPGFSDWWPPAWVERRQQREELAQRIQAAGGWEAIRRDCILFAGQQTNYFFPYWRSTNLPPAILALNPLVVQYVPQPNRIAMRIFGMHRTGGHSSPYLGLEVEVSTNSANGEQVAGNGNGGVTGNYHSVRKKVAEGIYELY